jgi:hypothetical protein
MYRGYVHKHPSLVNVGNKLLFPALAKAKQHLRLGLRYLGKSSENEALE